MMTKPYTKSDTLPIFDKKIISLLCLIPVLYVLMARFGPPEKLDGKLFYTGEQAHEMFRRFNDFQRHSYFINELFDLCFLYVYTKIFFVILRRLYTQKKWLANLALLSGGCDLLETTVIIVYLKFALFSGWFDWLGYVTCVKWVTAALILILIFFGLIKYRLIKRV